MDTIKSFPSHEYCECFWLNYTSSTCINSSFLLCASSACPLDRIYTPIALRPSNYGELLIKHWPTFRHIHTWHRLTDAGNMCWGRKKAPLVRGYLMREAHFRPSMTWQRTWQLCFEVLQTKYPLELFMLKRILVFRLPVRLFFCYENALSVARTIFYNGLLLLDDCFYCSHTVDECAWFFRSPLHIRSDGVMVWK